MAVHDHRDPQVGQPLCAECYDYPAHAVWQWPGPELWRRFTIKLWRGIAQHLGVTETACKALVRVQFAKVVEFQRRGIVHYHALIRLDGAPTPDQRFPPPAVQLGADLLADLAVRAAGQVEYEALPVDGADSPRRLRFGRQVDARPVHDQADRENAGGAQLHPETVSAYVAKYATKAAADLIPADGGPNPHLGRLKNVVGSLALRANLAGQTATDGAYKGWDRWVDMLGYRGHFASKSRRYSTTLGRLRQARRDHTRRQHLEQRQAEGAAWADQDQEADGLDTTLVVGSWRFAGIGWLTTGDAALAAASAARARDD